MERRLHTEIYIVSNSHCSNLQGVDLKVAYEKTPIECKLGDLGEACSQATKTNVLLQNSRNKSFEQRKSGIHGTRGFNRGRNA